MNLHITILRCSTVLVFHYVVFKFDWFCFYVHHFLCVVKTMRNEFLANADTFVHQHSFYWCIFIFSARTSKSDSTLKPETSIIAGLYRSSSEYVAHLYYIRCRILSFMSNLPNMLFYLSFFWMFLFVKKLVLRASIVLSKCTKLKSDVTDAIICNLRCQECGGICSILQFKSQIFHIWFNIDTVWRSAEGDVKIWSWLSDPEIGLSEGSWRVQREDCFPESAMP